jgi:predicted nucleic acid-binding protein
LEARRAAVIVVDTNVICYRWISSPKSAAAETALAKDPHWIAPVLWRSEFRNVLRLAIRQKALTIDAAQDIASKAEASFERREFAVSSDAIFQLVATSNCTAYDCEFVALAREQGVQLVTADRQILNDFPDVAISLERFARE